MGAVKLQTQVAPTGTSGYVSVYADSTSGLLSTIDSSSRAAPLMPFLGMFSSSNFTGTNVNTAQPIFDTTLDTITVIGSTAYIIDAHFHIETTGTTSHTLSLLFGGTATFTSIGYGAWVTNAATEVLGTPSTIWSSVATATAVSSALASATHHTVIMKGIMRINAAGTVIPQYQWSAAPGVAGVTLANSYFMLHPIGINTRTLVGPVA